MVAKIGTTVLGAILGLSIFFLLAWAYFVMPIIPFGALATLIMVVIVKIGRRG